MSTDLYRKYIDIINENSVQVNEENLEEGRIARILGALGLAAAAGIGGQHAAMTDPSALAKSPEFQQKLTQALEKDPQFQKYMSDFVKYDNQASAAGAGSDMSKQYRNMAFHAGTDAELARDQAAKNILTQLAKQQPTVWNAIKYTVNMNEEKMQGK